MSTDIVPFQPPAPQGNTLSIAAEAWKLANKVAPTEFVPKQLRGKPDAVLACILAGHEAGISPMQSLAKIHVVDGRPAMAAELMRALVLRAGHEIWVDEQTTTKCVLKGQRAGSSRVSTVTWTMDDAQRARLTGKDNWKNYPRAMMLARATTELCRQLFPDVLAGISHSIEELGDGDVVDVGDITPAAVREQTADTASPGLAADKTAAAAAPVDEIDEPAPANRGEIPPLPGEDDDDDDDGIIDAEVIELHPNTDDDDDGDADDPVDDDPAIGEPDVEGTGPTYNGPQLIAMRFTERGIRNRDDKLAAVSALVGHDVESSKDLTAAEVEAVLEYLAGDDSPLTLDKVVSDCLTADRVEIAPETPTERATAVNSATTWDEERWRRFVKAQKCTIVQAMKVAQQTGAEQDPPVKFVAFADIVGSDLADAIAAGISEKGGKK